MRRERILCLVLCVVVFMGLPALSAAEEVVSFKPDNVPAKGPVDARVTVYEIADFT